MIMRNGNTGMLHLFDISHNEVIAQSDLGVIGSEWQFAGAGPLNGAGSADMMVRNVNNGDLLSFDFNHSQIASVHSLGQVGLEWRVAGLGANLV